MPTKRQLAIVAAAALTAVAAALTQCPEEPATPTPAPASSVPTASPVDGGR